MRDPAELIERLRRLADARQAQAAAMRELPMGGRATGALGTVVVSEQGAITAVSLDARVVERTPVQLSERLWALYQQAVRDAQAATLAALPDDLVAEPTRHSVGSTADADAPGERTAGRPMAPAPWSHPSVEHGSDSDRAMVATGRVNWPAGIADGSPDAVMAELREQIASIVNRADAVGSEFAGLRGIGASPARHPLVRAEVTATGVPLSIAFTPASRGAAPTDLEVAVMGALERAKEDVAERARRLWDRADLGGDPLDPHPLHPTGSSRDGSLPDGSIRGGKP